MRGFKFVSKEQLNKDVQKEINFNSIIPKRGTKESAGYIFMLHLT